MNPRDTVAALLPSPRDDEPATLRQDIIDELSDHLACAYNREILRGADAYCARQRILDQFGDPAAVARRLWLDAMKGKIMAQRVLIATCLVVMLACGASVGLAWNWMNQDRLLKTREADEASRRMADALAESQAANREMLKQMHDMAEAVLHPVSPDWNPVIIKLTEEGTDKPPSAGFSLALSRLSGGAALAADGSFLGGGGRGRLGGMGFGGGMGGMPQNVPTTLIQRTSDASGVVDFGAVPPGDYTFGIQKFWPDAGYRLMGQLNVAPGSKVVKTIKCPTVPPERATVRVRVTWPADLEKEQLVLYTPFSFRSRILEPGFEWVMLDTTVWGRRLRRRPAQNFGWGPGMQSQAVRSIFSGPAGAATEIIDRAAPFFWAFSRADDNGNPVGAKHGVWGDILVEYLRETKRGNETPEPRELAWEPGTYGLDSLVVLRPNASKDVQSGRKRFDALLVSCVAGYVPFIQLRGEAAFNQANGPGRGGRGRGGVDRVVDRGGPPSKDDLQTTNRQGGGMAGNEPSPWQLWQEGAATVELSTEFWDKVDVAFEARAGQVNEWTIPLPDELISAVRTALKADAAAKAGSIEPASALKEK